MIDAGSTVLGRYIVEALVGEGGMGRVYRARHATLGMPVAVKVMQRQERADLVERFQREALLMSRVQDAHVVRVLDYGLLADGAPCLVMELLAGESLEARLTRRVTLPWREALAVMEGLLVGLQAIHAAGVVHRDLKPSNLLLAEDGPGGAEVPKLIDFGIARPLDDGPKLTRAGQLLGTPEYMAPEQLLGAAADFRADLYTAALMLYEMLSGQLPFVSEDHADLLLRIGNAPAPPPVPSRMPRPPQEVVDVLMDALALDPKQRPSTAGEFAAQLRAAADAAAREAVSEQRARTTGSLFPPPTEVEAVRASPPARFLFAARLPPSRLRDAVERRFLAGVAQGSARGYTLGAQHWFALQTKAAPQPEAMAAAEAIGRAVTERYGTTARFAYRTVEPGFALTAASLSGAAPLPETLRVLLEELSRDH